MKYRASWTRISHLLLIVPFVLLPYTARAEIDWNLSVPATSSTGAYTVTWDNNADPQMDESQFLEESLNGGAYTTVYSGTGESKSFSGKPDGTHSYRIRFEQCFPPVCTDTYTAPESIVVSSASAPGIPGDISELGTVGAAPGGATYTLDWTESTGAVDDYELQKKIGGTWTNIQVSSLKSKTESSVPPGVHQYRVRACNAGGCSVYTPVVSVSVMYDNITSNTSILSADAVGTIPYDFDVATDGDWLISVPLSLIPGVAGFKPALSLEYDSGRGVDRLERSLPEDTIGYGWRLAGLSQIRRCVVNQPSSNSIGLNSSDSLCLNGMPLVLTNGSHLTVGAIYRTTIESFIKIEAMDGGNGKLWFEAKMPDGTVVEYGNGLDSRVNENGSADFQWSINKSTSADGNVIDYEYFNDPAVGANYITRIDYDDAHVVFEYLPRSDAQPIFIGSASQTQTVFLHTIKVQFSDNNTMEVREYRLKHWADGSGRLRLNKVQLCAFDEWDTTGSTRSCLEPLDVDWSVPAESIPGVELLVDRLTDGLGAVTEVEYGTITGNSHSFLFTEEPFGSATAPADTQLLDTGSGEMRHVATKLRRDNGLGGFHDTTFAYQDVGLVSIRHWGFLGFFAQKSVDQESGVTSYTQNRVDFPHFGKIARVVEYDDDYQSYSNVLSERAQDYAVKQFNYANGSTSFPYVSNVDEFHYEGTTLLGAGQQQHARYTLYLWSRF